MRKMRTIGKSTPKCVIGTELLSANSRGEWRRDWSQSGASLPGDRLYRFGY